jgi:adenylate cyclase
MRASTKSIITNPWIVAVIVAHIVFVGLLHLRNTGALEEAELFAYDGFTALRAAAHAPKPRPIMIVGITEKDIQRYGWPLTDGLLSELLNRLVEQAPRVIVVDIYRDMPVGDGTERLNNVLTTHQNIIFTEKFPDETSPGVAPPTVLKDTDQVGFADVITDPGGIVRRALLFLDDGQRFGTSLALRAVLAYLEKEGIQPEPDANNPEFMRLGESTIAPFEHSDGGYVNADARGYQFLLDYLGIQKPLAMVTLSDIFSDPLAVAGAQGRIVLVGVAAESVNDYFFAPVEVADGIDRIPGIALHALAIDQLLRLASGESAPITSISNRLEVVLVWAWCLGGGAVAVLARSLLVFVVAAAAGIVLIGAAGYLGSNNAVWVPVVTPATGWVLSAALMTAYLSVQERRARAVLMSLFSRHVAPDVARLIWEERDQILKDGHVHSQQLMVTVLFTDMVGFTSVSERLGPEALMEWLNEYMDAMTRLVIENHGVIDKYIGDAIMAVWGVPFAHQTEEQIASDAILAVKTALAMRNRLEVMNARWREQGLPPISMRVGIHTGLIVAGSLGSAQRTDYTVIGDTVNIASRLESYDKSYNPDNSICRILIGSTTERYVRGAFQVWPVGNVELKGREQAVEAYRVTGPIESHALMEDRV